jgi:hypothetical protein
MVVYSVHLLALDLWVAEDAWHLKTPSAHPIDPLDWQRPWEVVVMVFSSNLDLVPEVGHGLYTQETMAEENTVPTEALEVHSPQTFPHSPSKFLLISLIRLFDTLSTTELGLCIKEWGHYQQAP